MRLNVVLGSCGTLLTIAIVASKGERIHATPSDDSKPVETTVCAILTSPQTYDGQVVSFEGRIISDGTHRVGADDLKCEDRIVTLLLARTKSEEDGINALLHAIYTGHPGTIDKDIFARIIGTMKYDSKGKPHFAIKVKKVQDMRVSRKKVD
jgi:hypothetical protein